MNFFLYKKTTGSPACSKQGVKKTYYRPRFLFTMTTIAGSIGNTPLYVTRIDVELANGMRSTFVQLNLPPVFLDSVQEEFAHVPLRNAIQAELDRIIDATIESGVVGDDVDPSFKINLKMRKRDPSSKIFDESNPTAKLFTGDVYLDFADVRLAHVLCGRTPEGNPSVKTETVKKRSWADEKFVDQVITTPVILFDPTMNFSAHRVFGIYDENNISLDPSRVHAKFDYLKVDLNAYEAKPKRGGGGYNYFGKLREELLTSVMPEGSSQDENIETMRELVWDFVTVDEVDGVEYPKIAYQDAPEWNVTGQKNSGTLPPNAHRQIRVAFAPGTYDAVFAELMIHEQDFEGKGRDGISEDFTVYISRTGVFVDPKLPTPGRPTTFERGSAVPSSSGSGRGSSSGPSNRGASSSSAKSPSWGTPRGGASSRGSSNDGWAAAPSRGRGSSNRR
jgi:hypothetical protein